VVDLGKFNTDVAMFKDEYQKGSFGEMPNADAQLAAMSKGAEALNLMASGQSPGSLINELNGLVAEASSGSEQSPGLDAGGALAGGATGGGSNLNSLATNNVNGSGYNTNGGLEEVVAADANGGLAAAKAGAKGRNGRPGPESLVLEQAEWNGSIDLVERSRDRSLTIWERATRRYQGDAEGTRAVTLTRLEYIRAQAFQRMRSPGYVPPSKPADSFIKSSLKQLFPSL
jgi:hypothetical protein